MDLVQYLIRSGSGETGFVYPTEVETRSYYGFGGFYIMGDEKDIPVNEYGFWAIHDGRLILTFAARYRDTRSFFRVDVPKVGNFLFYAQPMPKKYPYIGSVPELKNQFAIRRMRSWKPAALDQACKEHDFYFVGASLRTRSNANYQG